MEKRAEIAVENFRAGSACSQAVLMTYADYAGIDEALAHKLGTGFGGGIGRKQYTCGAITGAVAVLSLRYGNMDSSDADSKSRTYELVRDYMNAVEARLGSSNCRELLGVPTGTEEEHARAKALNVFDEICPRCIALAAEELERILADE